MGKHNQRLDSWKEIADYLGREVRTAIRWENERGLPVRRVPGGIRQGVFAFTSELDAWLVAQQSGNGIGTNTLAAESNGNPGHRSISSSTAVAVIPEPETSEFDFPSPPQLPNQTPNPPGNFFRKWQLIAIASTFIVSTGLYFAVRETRIPSRVNEPEMTFTRADYSASGPFQIVAADFNADGKVDLLFNNRDSNALTVLSGNGAGTFGPRIDSPSIDRPELFAVGDFNDDGKPDAAVGHQYSGDLLIQLGNGNGTFRRSAALKTPGLGRAVVVGDFNRDGKLDLAASFANPDSVSIFLGKGDGTFVAKASYRVTTGFLALHVADINADGKLDIACTDPVERGASPVSLLMGKGDGTFRAELIGNQGGDAAAKPPDAVSRMALGDLNNDGLIDLVTSNITNNLSISLGKGNGRFTHFADLDSGKGLGLVWTIDLDGDGKVDLLFVNCYLNRISIFLGNGDGSFKPRVDLPVGTYPAPAAMADFNGDGKIDIAIGNYGGDSVSVLLNTSQRRPQIAPGKR